MGWALVRGWALIKFFCLQDGRLFEVGANSRLGAYSNKYGIYIYSRDGLHIILHSAVHIYDFHIFITLHHHPLTGL